MPATLKVTRETIEPVTFTIYAAVLIYTAGMETRNELLNCFSISAVPTSECYVMLGGFNAHVRSRFSGDHHVVVLTEIALIRTQPM